MTAPSVRNRRVWRVRSGGDFFSTGVPSLLLAALIVPFLVLALTLTIGCWGIEYGAPPADTYSVPAPLLPKR